jgi:hypothetical protein
VIADLPAWSVTIDGKCVDAALRVAHDRIVDHMDSHRIQRFQGIENSAPPDLQIVV